MRSYSHRFISILIIAALIMVRPGMTFATDTRSMKLNLQDTDHSEFIDFMYSYAAENRLNIQWFGWYKTPKATRWYERSDRKSNFKININLLDIENGYIYLSSGPDENTLNLIINYGNRKQAWLIIVNDFEKQLELKGWKPTE